MNKKINDYEIMAPVGSRESLAAAIQAGANSVYFGIGKLNMRSHSANHFTVDDSVYRQIGLDTVCLTRLCNLIEVINGEVIGRM